MKLAELPFVQDITARRASEKVDSLPFEFTEDDDLDLCVYYLRTLHNVILCSSDVSRAVLASKYVAFVDKAAHIRGKSLHISLIRLIALL